jgi:hypothetical protein
MMHQLEPVVVPSTEMDSKYCDRYDVGINPVLEVNAGNSRFAIFSLPDESLVLARAHRARTGIDGISDFVVDRDFATTIGNVAVVVGRENQRLSDDSTLSRKHFEVAKDEGGAVVIRDLGSLNGTSLRPQRPEVAAPSHESIENERDATTREFVDALDSGASQLALEIVRTHPELRATRKVVVDGKEFFLSDVIGRSDHRPKAVMYTKANVDGREVVVPRLLYMSNSDGGWRVTYGMEGSRYSKEANEQGEAHYTQETKLARNIIEGLESQQAIDDPSGTLGRETRALFVRAAASVREVDTAGQEVTYYHSASSDKALSSARILSAGELSAFNMSRLHAEGIASVEDYLTGTDAVFGEAPEFLPDFRQEPTATYASTHSMLGPITVEEFPATLDGRAVTWSMAKDGEGRVWIENVYFPDSDITSYGNRTEVINMGVMTSKPLDYEQQADMLEMGTERVPLRVNDRPFNYTDITPSLDKLLPIAFYREARGIVR